MVPTGSRWLLTTATMLATMLYAIDSTIVNVALPHIQGSLQATQEQAAWVVTSYIVISAIATPLAGWLGTRFGLRRVLLTCVAGFTIGSVLCGIATELSEMVVFRMVQGAFGAALVPLSQVVLMREFPRSMHGRVLALWGMGVMVGPVIGPTLGGWLTDTFSWRWAFYINVPVGLIAWFGLIASLRPEAGDRRRPFDLTGFVLLSLALGLFQLMLDRGETNDWFASTEIVAEAFFSAVFLYMFVVHSLTSRQPFVDIHLFRDRNFLVSMIVMFVIGLSVISPSVLLPSFLQQLQGYSPSQAGVLVAARGASSILAMMLAGRLAGRLDPRVTMAVGMAVAAWSLALMGDFAIDTPGSYVVVAGLVQGIGTPLAFMPLNLVAFTTLPDAARAEAGALLTLIRNVGASVGISVMVALLGRSTQANQGYLAEHFTPYAAERWQAAGSPPGANSATGALLGEIGRQAAAIAYSNDFYLLAVCTLAALPLVLLLRARRADGRPPAATAAGDPAAAAVDAAH
jgi:DHA2 family multidrug resistance protein